MREAEYASFFQDVRELEMIHFIYSEITVDAFRTVKCLRLQRIELEGCDGVTGQALLDFVKQEKSLAQVCIELIISNCLLTTSEDIEALFQCVIVCTEQ